MITVLQVLEATEGGTRRHLRDLVYTLDAMVCRCVLAVSCGRDPGFRADLPLFIAHGIQVAEVPMYRGLALFADLLSLYRLVRCVCTVQPDVIHAHSAKAGGLARLAGRLCRIPVVYTPHSFAFNMQTGKWHQWLYRQIERGLRTSTAALIAVSCQERLEALALGYDESRVHFIPNGIGGEVPGVVTVRREEMLQIGFFGRLTCQKGPDLLVAAAADVVAHLPNVQFVFHGTGQDEARLRQQVGMLHLTEHVRFDGAYGPDEAVMLMRRMDVIVIPSRWEGCPYVALEAFQAGVPVVAAAVGGLSDLMHNGINGLLFQPEDPEDLGDALLQLLRDPGQRERMAQAARKTLAEHNLTAMTARILAVLKSVKNTER